MLAGPHLAESVSRAVSRQASLKRPGPDTPSRGLSRQRSHYHRQTTGADYLTVDGPRAVARQGSLRRPTTTNLLTTEVQPRGVLFQRGQQNRQLSGAQQLSFTDGIPLSRGFSRQPSYYRSFTAEALSRGSSVKSRTTDIPSKGVSRQASYKKPVVTPKTKPSIRSKLAQKIRVASPHLSLLAVLCVYIMLGAVVFHSIEKPHESAVRKQGIKEIELKKQEILAKIQKELEGNEDITKAEFEKIAYREIDKYMAELFGQFSDGYVAAAFEAMIDPHNSQESSSWTFTTSLLFCVTTLLTIGYGTPAPRTQAGRIFCVIYGLLGIPLTLVTIADLAKFLGIFLYTTYQNLISFCSRVKNACCRLAFKDKTQSPSSSESSKKSEERRPSLLLGDNYVPISLLLLVLVIYPAFSGILISFYEAWDWITALSFGFISTFTIGFGDELPENSSYFFLTILFLFCGVIISTMCVDLIAGQYIFRIHYFGRKLGAAKQRAQEAMVMMGSMWKNAAGLAAMNIAQLTNLFLMDLDPTNMPPGIVPRRSPRPSFHNRAFLPQIPEGIDFADVEDEEEKMFASFGEYDDLEKEMENVENGDLVGQMKPSIPLKKLSRMNSKSVML